MPNQTTSVSKTDKHYDITSGKMTVEPKVKLNFKNEPKKFSPLNARLMTQTITKKTPDSYYNQIKNNMYMGALSYWYVARDLTEAKESLTDIKFEQLTSDLNFSKSTITRYIQIATSDRCITLFKEDILPESWTTCIELIKLGKKDWDKLIDADILDSTTTMTQIKKELAKGKKRKMKPVVMIVPFAAVSIDKSKIQTSKLKNFQKVFEKFANSHKEFLSYAIDKNVEKKVTAFQKKLTSTKDNSKKKSVKSRKNKELK